MNIMNDEWWWIYNLYSIPLDLNLDEEVGIQILIYHMKQISESIKDLFVIGVWDFQ